MPLLGCFLPFAIPTPLACRRVAWMSYSLQEGATAGLLLYGRGGSADSLAVCVEVEASAPDERCQGDARTLGEVHCQAARRPHRRQDGDVRHCRLLDHLEAAPTTDHQQRRT